MNQISGETIALSVPELEQAERIDSYVAGRVDKLTRSAIKRMLEDGLILVGGEQAKPSQKLRGGEQLSITIPRATETEVEPEAVPLEILFEDKDLIVVNKPAGMVVHPAPGHSRGTLVNALLHHCSDLSGINGELRPGIVHRLDMGTTGVIIAAKNDRAHQGLSSQFQQRTVEKIYQTVVFGPLREDSGIIETLIERDPGNRLRMAVSDVSGREAVSSWRVAGRMAGCSLLHVRIHTGRTHQVRVHCAHMGHPVVGDELYAGKRWRGVENPVVRSATRKFPRPALHAWKLGIRHPLTDENMLFEAPLPEDMSQLLRKLRDNQ